MNAYATSIYIYGHCRKGGEAAAEKRQQGSSSREAAAEKQQQRSGSKEGVTFDLPKIDLVVENSLAWLFKDLA